MQFRKYIILLVLALLATVIPNTGYATQEDADAVPEFISSDKQDADVDAIGDLIAKLESQQQQDRFSSKEESHIEYIVNRYKISREDAEAIVENAKKLADPVFPKYSDILAVIEVESNFNRKASSKGNCLGLMQLKYAYHKSEVKSRKELFDIAVNMRIATTYLSDLFSQVNNSSLSYSSFNTGLGAFQKGKRNRIYMARVNKAKHNFV